MAEQTSGAGSPQSPRIAHSAPGFTGRSDAPAGAASPTPPASEGTSGAPTAPPLADSDASTSATEAAPPPQPASGLPKIRTFGDRRRHEDSWARTPNTTGAGAIHVRTFHSKLTDEAMNYLDQSINEWLDAHPQYEVKFATATIGEFTGKLREPHLIVQVWV